MLSGGIGTFRRPGLARGRILGTAGVENIMKKFSTIPSITSISLCYFISVANRQPLRVFV